MDQLCSIFKSTFTYFSSSSLNKRNSHNNSRQISTASTSFSDSKNDTKSLLNETISISDISSKNPCIVCQNPCPTHPSYPSNLKFDLTSPLKDTIQPYIRHVIISTGKSDWEKIIELNQGSLASELSKCQSEIMNNNNNNDSLTKERDSKKKENFKFKKDRIMITNCSRSNTQFSLFNWGNDVLIFPDNLLIRNVSVKHAKEFYNQFLLNQQNKSIEIKESDTRNYNIIKFEKDEIPYKAVILICSHKRRDIRCGVAGPLLKNEFEKVLKDMKLDLKSNGNNGVAVYLSSHVGGHHFAGNVIIYRNNQGIFYGRVTPCHVRMIVEKTVIGGKVIKELYRGSMKGSFINDDVGKLDW
ncbi:Sucrase/ferredoxin-like-domain-containing protein [Gigaspora rosea]|uniref:Sucrase/ferredoxin-like-domain-containing protein n=1 Tax=Gigaspora rosea TaxID=44941 RepID=A0A397UHU9_9GLOM|nr:Sucrase/ferredoxin-like-domain-containing protein [Gigaspora rosea]